MNAATSPASTLHLTWRRLARLWLLLVVLLVGLLLWQWPTLRVASSVLELLPTQEQSGVDPAWQQGLMARLDRQLFWLVSVPDSARGQEAALWWYQVLQRLPELESVAGPSAGREQIWSQDLFAHRYQRIGEAGEQRLQQGAAHWSQWVLGQIYSPLAGVSPKEWQADPLLLTRSAISSAGEGALSWHQGWLVSRDGDGRDWYLLHAQLKGSAFDLQRGPELVSKLANLSTQWQQHFPGGQMVRRGTLYFSDYAATLARADISTIGVGSLVGVMLLIWWFFRGLRPLLLCTLPLVIGMVCGLLAVIFWFGQIHLFTLVISASLIGISDDYSLHYLSERRLHHGEESPLATALRLRQPLTLALVTTLLGYLLLWLTPFPGLQQMALFSLAGLIGSFVTVLLWFPLLVGQMPERPLPGRKLLLRWLVLWQGSRLMRLGLPLLLLLIAGGGLLQLQVDDDIRRLQPLPTQLSGEEQHFARLTGQDNQLTGFLVTGESAEQALQRLEDLTGKLRTLQAQGAIVRYRSLSDWLPSLQRQQANYQALVRLQPEVIRQLEAAGVAVSASAPPPFVPIEAASWLASPMGEGLRLLWLQREDGSVGVVVPVSGIRDGKALAAATGKLAGVYWQDKRAQWSDLFSRYRLWLGALLLLGMALCAGVLWHKLGLGAAARIMAGNALALLLAAAVLGWCGQPFTLFALLAMSLVFGIGIDYGLFFAHSAAHFQDKAGGQKPLLATLLAVVLANLTTQLAFGLLALSHTPAIAGFGLVLSVGVFVSFLLSPLALPYRKGVEPCA